MLYLILAILSSTAIALILKYSENYKLNRNIVTSANYVIASLFSFLMLLSDNLNLNFDFSLDLLYPILKNETLTDSGSILWCLILGIISGALYFLGFILIQVNIKLNGVGLTGAFSKLGIFIPILFSIIIWNEIPTGIKFIGIALTISSIFIINKPGKGKSFLKNLNFLLIILLFVVGTGDFANKIFEKYGNINHKNLYLTILFFTALIISSTFAIKNIVIDKYKIKLKEIIVGTAVGIPNLFTSYFLIKSFAYLNTSVIYSIFSSGTILLITLCGILIFKEKLSKREYTAIGVTIPALILLSI